MARTPFIGPLVWCGIILTTCLILILCQHLLWLVFPILLAVVLYYLTQPLVIFVMVRGWSRQRAVFLATGVHMLILAAILSIAVPLILEASVNWQNLADEGLQASAGLLERIQNGVGQFLPISQLKSPPVSPVLLKEWLATWAQGNSTNIVMELVYWVPSILLIPYFTYFLLLDGARFKTFLVRAIPNAFFERALELFFEVDEQLRRYFQGLIILTGLDAFCLGVGLMFLQVHFPFALGIIAAVLAWLPYLGSIGGCFLVVLVASAQAPDRPSLAWETVILFIVVRLLDDFVFLPLTIGRSLRMHPLLTVVMILLGGAVAGFAGLLLVMPVFGVVTVIGQMIGELLTDERILARHRHANRIRRRRARVDLFDEERPTSG